MTFLTAFHLSSILPNSLQISYPSYPEFVAPLSLFPTTRQMSKLLQRKNQSLNGHGSPGARSYQRPTSPKPMKISPSHLHPSEGVSPTGRLSPNNRSLNDDVEPHKDHRSPRQGRVRPSMMRKSPSSQSTLRHEEVRKDCMAFLNYLNRLTLYPSRLLCSSLIAEQNEQGQPQLSFALTQVSSSPLHDEHNI